MTTIRPADTPLLPDVKIIDLHPYTDERGFFMESYNERLFKEKYGIDERFVQDNHSSSNQDVLRGLHYQVLHPQGKLVRVIAGSAYDVAVDLRKGSPSFGKWMGVTLTADEKKVIWIPAGFAHGFLSLEPGTVLLYKATDFYSPQGERCLLWNDPALGIVWPLQGEPILSAKDRQGKLLKDADLPQ